MYSIVCYNESKTILLDSIITIMRIINEQTIIIIMNHAAVYCSLVHVLIVIQYFK